MNPFRMCLDCFQGPSFTQTQSYATLREEAQIVRLDTAYIGSEVVILKNGTRICGTGGALATAPIVQNKAYFQVNVQQTGIWGVGLANRSADLNKVTSSENAWILNSAGELVSGGEVLGKACEDVTIEEGDSIGVAFDHVELSFYVNGTRLPNSITAVRGQVFPVVYVDNAILDVKFRSFSFDAPPGYEEIMLEQTLL
uniref:SPRY domain-containing protein 7 n=1 Tax=Steinernema glaseri TaxID=37863 RepID=A0A1I8A1H0_9BILA